MALYGSVEYWDKRYSLTANLAPVEWYRSYGNLRHLLNPISFSTPSGINTNVSNGSSTNNAKQQPTTAIASSSTTTATSTWSFPTREECRVLILGCGCSTFGEDMIRDGWTGPITNVDYSQVVIDQMTAKYNDAFYENIASKKGNAKSGANSASNRMKFVCADITDEATITKLFPDSSFDLIVCKATLDAVLNTSTPRINALKLIRQCHRMLATQHGILFVVSNGNSDNRLEYLEHDNDLHYYWQSVGIHSMNNHRGGRSHPQNQQRSSSASASSAQSEKNVHVYICRKRSIVTGNATANEAISTSINGKENTQNRDITAVEEGVTTEKSQPLGPTKN